MNKFLRDGQKDAPKAEFDTEATGRSGDTHSMQDIPKAPGFVIDSSKLMPKKNPDTDSVNDVAAGRPLIRASTSSASQISLKSFTGSQAPCKKAKLARIERKKEKLALRGLALDDVMKDKQNKNVEKSLEDFLGEELKDGSVHKLKVSADCIKHHLE
jgi:arginine-tRNA-protein transferase